MEENNLWTLQLTGTEDMLSVKQHWLFFLLPPPPNEGYFPNLKFVIFLVIPAMGSA